MTPRLLASDLRAALKQFPAVTLAGPRQCGKTTLAKSMGGRAGVAYFDLEQESDRLKLDVEWERLVTARRLVVLDEAQAAPEVFPRLRGAIDDDRTRRGRFLLTGSVAPGLMRNVSESLAGRMGLVELSPFLLPELPFAAQRARHWLMGGYPDGGIQVPRDFPRWGVSYIRSISERDLPTLGMGCSPQLSARLLRMLAHLQGTQWNASELGRSLGINYQTAGRYVDFVEGAFIVRRIPAFHANLRKRLVKAPRLYWRDSGLLHAVLGINSESALLAHPVAGASWEGYVIEQAISVLQALAVPFHAHTFRTSDGYELDLVLEVGTERWAIEIKLTSNPSPHQLQRVSACAEMVQASRAVLVTRTARNVSDGPRLSCNLPGFLTELRTLARRTRDA